MKKLMALVLCITLLFLVGCTKKQPKPHTQYTAYGRYYTDGVVITEDGNEWLYDTDLISDREPYDSMPIWVGFDDNGTDNIEDDIILGLVYDVNTAIYDALEDAMSDIFTVDRDGNNLKVAPKN